LATVNGSEAHEDARSWPNIAEGQAGVVGRRQLRDCGLSADEIKSLRKRKILLATAARGVYRIAGAQRSWRQDLWVALLAGPDGTLASHVSAAALRGLLSPPAVHHVTVPRPANGRFKGAIVHHGTVSEADRGTCDGFAATALGRTIVDCAAVLPQKPLNQFVDAAFGRSMCSSDAVIGAWERAGRMRGGDLLREALAPYSAGAKPGSVKAAHLLRRVYEWGLPLPLCEYEIRDTHGGFVARVDFIWTEWWFVLEYDGDEFHGPRRWGIDDRVQAEIESLGFRLERADRFDLRPSSTRLHDLLGGVLLQPPRGPWPLRRPPEAPFAA
jgi:hypothetical protein